MFHICINEYFPEKIDEFEFKNHLKSYIVLYSYSGIPSFWNVGGTCMFKCSYIEETQCVRENKNLVPKILGCSVIWKFMMWANI